MAVAGLVSKHGFTGYASPFAIDSRCACRWWDMDFRTDFILRYCLLFCSADLDLTCKGLSRCVCVGVCATVFGVCGLERCYKFGLILSVKLCAFNTVVWIGAFSALRDLLCLVAGGRATAQMLDCCLVVGSVW